MIQTASEGSTVTLPEWVPKEVCHYLAHTEAGQPIRHLARQSGVHASTILRQVRRFEAQRDDPLIDAALRTLGQMHFRTVLSHDGKDHGDMTARGSEAALTPDKATLAREARRVLRRLCETGAVLAVAAEMEKSVVVRDTGNGTSTRTAVVDSAAAQAMALKGWITCDEPGRISRYRITAAGRSALSHLLAEHENRARGMAEARADFDHEAVDALPAPRRRARPVAADSPLALLARRRDKDGVPFLSEPLVSAGERLREDFELGQIGSRVAQNWDQFLTGGVRPGAGGDDGLSAAAIARDRVAAALADLGPGLGDVALRCCCYLEGLETAEKRMGWSSRSGKIVLRIALQRLKRHYDETSGPDSGLIG